MVLISGGAMHYAGMFETRRKGGHTASASLTCSSESVEGQKRGNEDTVFALNAPATVMKHVSIEAHLGAQVSRQSDSDDHAMTLSLNFATPVNVTALLIYILYSVQKIVFPPIPSPTRVQARLCMDAQMPCNYRPVSDIHSEDARAFRWQGRRPNLARDKRHRYHRARVLWIWCARIGILLRLKLTTWLRG